MSGEWKSNRIFTPPTPPRQRKKESQNIFIRNKIDINEASLYYTLLFLLSLFLLNFFLQSLIVLEFD